VRTGVHGEGGAGERSVGRGNDWIETISAWYGVRMKLAELSEPIISAALKVHSSLGPGLLERAYHACLAYELRSAGHTIAAEVPVPLVYKGVNVELGYRIDLLVNNTVAVEVKAVAQLLPVHRSQVLTQLKFSGLPLGLLFNFHELHLKDGIARFLNTPK
jgi:GxxExxY protein